MKLFALFSLVGLVAGSLWSNDQQYTYQFTSQVLTGIPELNRQYAGLRITAKLVLQRITEQTYMVQLLNTKYKTYNDILNLSEEKDILNIEEVDVPANIKVHLEAPFKIVLDKNELFKEIYIGSDEPVFVSNLKKSLVNGGSPSLNPGYSMTSMLDTNTIQKVAEQKKSYFKTMEKSVGGECEVEHTINKLPEYMVLEFEQKEANMEAAKACQGKDYFEVIKVKNFQKCNKRTIAQQTYGSNAKSDGSMAATSPVVTESSIRRSIHCGTLENSIYRKTTIESKYLTSANGGLESVEKIEVISRKTFILNSIEPVTAQIKDVVNPKSFDIHYEFPVEDYWTSTASDLTRGSSLPDMTSVSSLSLFPVPLDSENRKQVFVDTFVEFVELSTQSPESSHAGKDVNEKVLIMTKLVLSFSYTDIQEVWSMIQENIHDDAAHKANAEHVFLDLLTIAGTNPCVKYICEMVKNQVIIGEPAAWIVANMIKSVKTPTEELIQELTTLLKHSTVQSVPGLKATVAMSLSELVHRACIDETSSIFNYPVGIFGQFCSKDSKVIKKDLLPFLVEKLEEQKYQLQQEQPTIAAMNSALVYINALGNLGLEESSFALLEMIEGKMSMHPHPRSVAVYKLIRSARTNPSVYRPVILSIIENIAENEEVRMAAISVLPYTLPSSADMQKLAIRTWFESSQQVSSYITSTLKSLKDLPLQAPLYQKIAQKAEEAYKLAKPMISGIQTSHNIKIVQFLDTLKSAVTLKLQYVNSEESAIPRTMYVKSDIQSKSQSKDMFESAVYVQGSEVLMEKMYNLYKIVQNQELPQQEQESILNIKNRMPKQPEAHVTLKMLGLQRFYSIDYEFIQEIVLQLTNEFMNDNQSNGIKKEFLKVFDLAGFTYIIPTESGLPLYVQQRTPMVISTQASLVMVKNGEVEIKMKPVLNYKQTTSVGLFCPFTQKFLGAGVDTSVHVAAPLMAEVALQHGQLSITLKTSDDVESQNLKPVVALKVMPYTTEKTPIAETSQTKIIHTSSNEKKMMEVQLGEKIGIDLKLKMESEHKFTDLASFLHVLSHHHPLTLLSLPLPLMTARSHSVSLTYNPSTSVTKEASFVMSVGYGKKPSANQKPFMIYPLYQVDQEVETQCKEEQECMKEKFCNKEKQHCLTELRKQNRPTSEINKYCSMKFYQCSQRHVSRLNTRSVLSKLQSGSAVTFNVIASLRGDHESTVKEIETHFTVGHKPAHHKAGEKTETKILTSLRIAPNAMPFELEVQAATKMHKPISKWNKEAILQQNLNTKMTIKADFGIQGEEKASVSAEMQAVQSEDQKTFAKNSVMAKKCESHVALGQLLSEACKQARTQASALDVVEAVINVPTSITKNTKFVSLTELLKVYYLPYLSISKTETLEDKLAMDKFVVKAKIDQFGKKLSMNVENQGHNTELNNLRIENYLQGLMPISTKENAMLNIVEQLTVHGAPSVCSVEGGKVRTFDKLQYNYLLNDCEHVIFKDCSPANTVEVSVKKTAQFHHVKVILANVKYDLELTKPIRSSRMTIAAIKVNGQQKTIQHGHHGKQQEKTEFVELAQNYYVDEDTYLTSYEDGVYAIVSKLYGLAVYADVERVEVKTFQHSLRNKACGLCGDLNDEKTADMKSAGSCIMSSPKLAAYSYMVADTKCTGIPARDLKQYQDETNKCIKKEVVPTKVTEVWQQKKMVAMKHLIEESTKKVCISKLQVNVCGSSVSPKQIIIKEVPFFCLPKDTTGSTLMRMAEQGEKIQNVEEYPTIFTKMVSNPIQC